MNNQEESWCQEWVFWLLNLYDKCSPVVWFHSHPRSLSFPAHRLHLRGACLGSCRFLICSFWPCQSHLVQPPLPFSCLTRWVLAPNPAHWRCRCAGVLCLHIRKWGRKQGRLWCRPPQKWTILIMTVHTNFPEGLQRLRTDSTPRADLTIDFPSSLVPSEEANLSLPFWHFWGWRY